MRSCAVVVVAFIALSLFVWANLNFSTISVVGNVFVRSATQRNTASALTIFGECRRIVAG